MDEEILLQTDRLSLRRYTMKDLDWFHKLGMNEEVMRFIRPVNYDMEKSRKELNNMMAFYYRHSYLGYWLAVSKEDGQRLGTLTLRKLEGSKEIELGYRWTPSSWGKGYATEAARGLLNYGFFKAKYSRIVAVIHPKNIGSQKVLEKCGFEYEKMAHYYNHHVKYYGINADQYHRALKPN